MSVYLGEDGGIEIRRTGEPVGFVLEPEDVNATEKRFSVAFNGPNDANPFITGDQVEITRTDGTIADNLILVAGSTDRSITRWVHVDQLGGMRLYSTYADAIAGDKATAETLVAHSANQDISIDVANLDYRCVASMRDWEITTNRDTIDTTVLGREYREFYDQGLISAQGRINAFWPYSSDCAFEDLSGSELAKYFSDLVIRFKEGSRFKGYFFVLNQTNASVWYECDAIVTNVAMGFAPGQPITSTVQFISTGPVILKQGQPPAYLLQEDTNLINLEEGPGKLELEFDL